MPLLPSLDRLYFARMKTLRGKQTDDTQRRGKALRGTQKDGSVGRLKEDSVGC